MNCYEKIYLNDILISFLGSVWFVDVNVKQNEFEKKVQKIFVFIYA